MRIIRGSHKGRYIQVPKGFKARPTTDYAKEGLFGVLDNIIDYEEIIALDLFAGTGGIGLELVSRGAAKVVQVEKEPLHCRFIQKSIEKFQFENIHCIRADAWKYVKQTPLKFDFVFADPPYDMDHFDLFAQGVLDIDIISDGGIFVLEHSDKYSFKQMPEYFDLRKYGRVHFSFFRISK